MRYSVSSYSFSQAVNKGEITYFDCIAKAKEMGFNAIEFTDSAVADIETAKKYREKAESVGIEISNYAVGADLLLGEDEIRRVCGQVDIAAALGCKYMRHDVTGGAGLKTYEGYDSVIDRLACACRRITEYAAQRGIRTMTENHGYFSQDSLRVEKLINTVASENFGWLVDIGNFVCADDEPSCAVGRAAKYAFYVHAKDFIIKGGDCVNPGRGFFKSRGGRFLRGTVIGHGNVPVVSCLRALDKAKYDGYICVEFEGMENCFDGIGMGLENLKRFAALL